MANQVAVIGSSNVDMMMKMEALPTRGETVTGATYMQVFGGKGANQAVGSARAGARTLFVNAVGNDPYKDRMVRNFEEDGIDCSCMFHFDDVPSGHALCMIGEEGANYLSVAPGANDKLGVEEIRGILSTIRAVPVWLLQCEIPEETNRFILRQARTPENRVLWNYAPAVKMEAPPLDCCDVFIVNEVEAKQLTGLSVTGRDSARTAARALLDRGAPEVILSLGAAGVLSLAPGREIFLPAHEVEVIDTVGAGDCFCGALACALAEDQDWPTALEFASAAAALSVTRLGAQPSIPKRPAIEAFMKAHPLPAE